MAATQGNPQLSGAFAEGCGRPGADSGEAVQGRAVSPEAAP